MKTKRKRRISWLFKASDTKKKKEYEIEKEEDKKLVEPEPVKPKPTKSKEVKPTKPKKENKKEAEIKREKKLDAVEEKKEKPKVDVDKKDTIKEKIDKTEEIDKNIKIKTKPEPKKPKPEVGPINSFPNVDEIDNLEDVKLKDEFKDSVEVYIVEEIRTMIEHDRKDLEELEYEIKLLEEEKDQEALTAEVEKLYDKLQKIIAEFEKIQQRYSDSYHFVNFYDLGMLNEYYVEDLIGDYKNKKLTGLDDKTLIEAVEEIKEYINIIDKIIEVDITKDNLKEEINDKIDDYKERDKQFDESQENLAQIEKFNEEALKTEKDIKIMLEDLENKINNSVDWQREINQVSEIVFDIDRVIQATLLFAASKTLPNTRRGNIFKAIFTASAIMSLFHCFRRETHTEEKITRVVTDYETEIKRGMENLDDVIDNIDYALGNIEDLEKIFDDEFSEFSDRIPEYDDLFRDVLRIKNELEEQKVRTKEYGKDLNYLFRKNKVKVKG